MGRGTFVTKFEESMDDDFNTAGWTLAANLSSVKPGKIPMCRKAQKEFTGHTFEVMTKPVMFSD